MVARIAGYPWTAEDVVLNPHITSFGKQRKIGLGVGNNRSVAVFLVVDGGLSWPGGSPDIPRLRRVLAQECLAAGRRLPYERAMDDLQKVANDWQGMYNVAAARAARFEERLRERNIEIPY